jgi:hypothetical protein
MLWLWLDVIIHHNFLQHLHLLRLPVHSRILLECLNLWRWPVLFLLLDDLLRSETGLG